MTETDARSRPGVLIKNVVFATDFLESSRLALDYAVAFAHRFGAKLTIVHAFELRPEAEEIEMTSHRPSLSRERANARLQALAAGVRRLGIEAEVDLRSGEPCATILASVAQGKADLLVLGTHGIYRGVQHILVGSNAEKILLSAECPTLTVGRHVMAGIDLRLSFGEILFVSDMSRESVSAAHYALSLGETLGIPTELIVLAPENGMSEPDRTRSAAEKYCADLLVLPKFSNHPWSNPAFLLERMAPVEEVTERALTSDDILLVLGVHDMSRLKRHFHASYAFELIARSCCPVLSIRGSSTERR